MASGTRLYLTALAAGGGGMLTFGWDAGVLGGVLLTPAFQSAMGVSDLDEVTHRNHADVYRRPMSTPYL